LLTLLLQRRLLLLLPGWNGCYVGSSLTELTGMTDCQVRRMPRHLQRPNCPTYPIQALPELVHLLLLLLPLLLLLVLRMDLACCD
jgi:hypothetical protein